MNDSIIINNHDDNDDDDTIDRSDEIVSDMISLIHSTTHSSYVTCSQLSSKLISYLSQIHIKDNQWNDLEKAVEVIYLLLKKNKIDTIIVFFLKTFIAF
jgi:hypothetical protein